MTRTQLLKLFQKIRPSKIPSKHTHIYVSKLGAYSNQKWTGVTRPGHFYQRQERTFQSTSTDRQSDRSIDRSIVRSWRSTGRVRAQSSGQHTCMRSRNAHTRLFSIRVDRLRKSIRLSGNSW